MIVQIFAESFTAYATLFKRKLAPVLLFAAMVKL